MQRVRLPKDEYDKKKYVQDLQSYKQWLQLDSGSNTEELNEVKKNVVKAINLLLTKKQKEYVVDYYVNGLNMKDIAEKNGVDKSCVSRTIKRARSRMKLMLSFSSPSLLKATLKEYE